MFASPPGRPGFGDNSSGIRPAVLRYGMQHCDATESDVMTMISPGIINNRVSIARKDQGNERI
jgi:hypothetical protein